jgi:hypothetical protein
MRQALTAGMMQRLGIRSGADMHDADPIDSEFMPAAISADYESLITQCFQCLGLTSELVRVSVRPVGQNPAGLEIFAAFIKVLRWEPGVVQVLTRMPHVEKKIEKCIRQSTMLRYSAFAGLWFHTPPHLEGAPAPMH